jgi:hypothetical protein
MLSFEDQVRQAQSITESNLMTGGFYRGLFYNGNFYLYKHVEKGRGYRGNKYPCEGYVLAYSDVFTHDKTLIFPPTFIPRGV